MSTISRGITATWWYTFSGVLMFQLVVAFVWTTVLFNAVDNAAIGAVVGVGGLIWCGSAVPLLLQYRHRDDAAGLTAGWRGTLLPLTIAVAYGAACGILAGLWIAAFVPVVQSLMLLNWPAGVRVRLVIVVSVVLAGLWFIDMRTADVISQEALMRTWWVFGVFSIMLPPMTVLSLWWWDVVVTLDRARVAEARLSATQERLRVATDVHDLQGHHLQVIALQLELAERLLAKGQADAALEQLHLARTSVSEARQGTRDLATRFRGVPLPDEIANAVDLLRAAGTTAEATVDPGAAAAGASVLGPVIRETTTNVLKHGGGKWARLSLAREGDAWRYEISNDAASDEAASDDGAGLDGVGRRVSDAGGRVEVRRGRHEFAVVVTVPAVGGGEAR
ncbi:histidine kinase [Microbacterium sp.]|uniref:sensor histidine kinase n=1 Tax=Microbacterium sp. TaxID=51671 RepID=UPI002811F7CA|nr:histidine kinase [Microbacterium sp.]